MVLDADGRTNCPKLARRRLARKPTCAHFSATARPPRRPSIPSVSSQEASCGNSIPCGVSLTGLKAARPSP
jgi:hypothetical protein